MTASFRLSADGLTTFEFLTGAIRLKEGWTIGETLTESWEFIGQGTGSVLRAELAALTALLNNAREWAVDPLRSGPTWLEFHADGEPDSRRRLVLDGGREFLNKTGINPLMTNQRVAIEVQLEFAYPWWEKEGETTVYSSTVNCLGGKITIPAGGDMDSRISRLHLDGLVDPGLLTAFWIGSRQVYGGSSELVNVWQCSLGTSGTDASNAADTDTISGNRKAITFATATLSRRLRIKYSQVVGANDPTHLRGNYLVLLRYKLPTTSTSIALELRYGYSGDTKAIQDAVILSSGSGMSAYGVAEIGNVTFPPGVPRGVVTSFAECEIDIYAERITGASHLYLAEIILVPSDHLLRITGASTGPNTGDFETNVYTHEDEEVAAYGYDLIPNANARPEPENWQLPYQEDSVMVVVGAISSTELRKSDVIDLNLYAHKRWQSYST